jgi:hypothetical protein
MYYNIVYDHINSILNLPSTSSATQDMPFSLPFQAVPCPQQDVIQRITVAA